MNKNLISIVLPTKNSFPLIKKAIEGIKRQTYKNYELIIQDGGSTDGTLEYLEGLDIPNMSIISKPDSCIGQAYGRAIARSNGDFVCFTATDELLLDHSLEMGLSWFEKNPDAAAIFGAISLVNQEGDEVELFTPKQFDLLKFMSCAYFPTFGSLFNRKVIGKDFYYDETLKSCPDYEFWLRLGSRFSKDQLLNRSEVFSIALRDSASMTYRSESYKQFSSDKILILNRYLKKKPQNSKFTQLKNVAQEGIFAWTTRGYMGLEGIDSQVIKYSRKEQECYEKTLPKEFYPTQADITFESLHVESKKKKSFPLTIQGFDAPWGYMYQWHFKNFSSPYWVKIRLKVKSGAIGICLMNGKQIKSEKLRLAENKEVTVYLPFDKVTKPSLIVRNGGIPSSKVTIYEVSLVKTGNK